MLKIFKGYAISPVLTTVFALALAIVILVTFFTSTFSLYMNNIPAVEIPDHYVTTAVVNSLSALDYNSFLKNGEALKFNTVKAIDARSSAMASAAGIQPAYPDYYNGSGKFFADFWFPADTAAFVATCTSVEQEKNGFLTCNYRVDQVVMLNESFDTPDEFQTYPYVPLPKEYCVEGQTYLIWGHYNDMGDGNQNILVPVSAGPGSVKTVEQDGSHLLKENTKGSGNYYPVVSELNTSLEAFWSTEVGQLWKDTVLIKEEIVNHSLGVVGTDCLDSIYMFNTGEAPWVEGGSFSDQNYANGDKVCVISEELAKQNDLSVGDKLPLQIYPADYFYGTLMSSSSHYPDTYDPYAGFSDEGEWEIVGIYSSPYRMYEEEGFHDIHPNTVFLPKSSLMGTYDDPLQYDSTVPPDIRQLSFILPTGGEETFLAEAASLGYSPDAFTVYNGGRTEGEAAALALQESVTAWQNDLLSLIKPLPVIAIVLLAVIMLLFSLTKKKEIGILYSFETRRGTLFGHVFLQFMIICIPALLLSVLLTRVLWSTVMNQAIGMLEPTISEQVTALMPSTLPILSVILQQALILVVIATIASAVSTFRRYHFEYRGEE